MRIPVIHSAVSLAINAAILVLLLLIFDMDVFAWIIADMIFALLMCILNARSLRKYLRYRQEVMNTFVKPAFAAVVMGVAVYFIHMLIHSVIGHSWDIIFSIIIAVIIYVILLLLLRVIDETKLMALPGGRKIVRLFRKLRLL